MSIVSLHHITSLSNWHSGAADPKWLSLARDVGSMSGSEDGARGRQLNNTGGPPNGASLPAPRAARPPHYLMLPAITSCYSPVLVLQPLFHYLVIGPPYFMFLPLMVWYSAFLHVLHTPLPFFYAKIFFISCSALFAMFFFVLFLACDTVIYSAISSYSTIFLLRFFQVFEFLFMKLWYSLPFYMLCSFRYVSGFLCESFMVRGGVKGWCERIRKERRGKGHI